MKFEIISARAGVSQYISRHLYFRHTFEAPQVSPYVPRGCAILGFCLDFSESQEGYLVRGIRRSFEKGHMYLFGQSTEVFLNGFKGRYSILATFLDPCYTACLLHDRADLIIDDILDITTGPNKIFMEELCESNSMEEQIRMAEDFIYNRIQKKTTNRALRQSIDAISQFQGHMSEEALIKQCQTSRRTLQRLFAEEVGISPKEFSSIIRFRKMVRLAIANPNYTWLDAVNDFNYYDQSHLIKTFHKFTGSSPEQYLSCNQLIDSKFLKSFQI